jgi:hypothetical protein
MLLVEQALELVEVQHLLKLLVVTQLLQVAEVVEVERWVVLEEMVHRDL